MILNQKVPNLTNNSCGEAGDPGSWVGQASGCTICTPSLPGEKKQGKNECAQTEIRTRDISATTKGTNHYTIHADSTEILGDSNTSSHLIGDDNVTLWIKQGEKKAC